MPDASGFSQRFCDRCSMLFGGCLCLQDAVAAAPSDSQDSRWVLGWQFAAGEYLQMSRDVFGDDGIQKVFMSPSLQGPGADTGAEAAAAGRGMLGQSPQRVAVFSRYHCCVHRHKLTCVCDAQSSHGDPEIAYRVENFSGLKAVPLDACWCGQCHRVRSSGLQAALSVACRTPLLERCLLSHHHAVSRGA